MNNFQSKETSSHIEIILKTAEARFTDLHNFFECIRRALMRKKDIVFDFSNVKKVDRITILNLLFYCRECKKRNVGFSFHSYTPAFKQILVKDKIIDLFDLVEK